jgi:hypothetical protein
LAIALSLSLSRSLSRSSQSKSIITRRQKPNAIPFVAASIRVHSLETLTLNHHQVTKIMSFTFLPTPSP